MTSLVLSIRVFTGEKTSETVASESVSFDDFTGVIYRCVSGEKPSVTVASE